MFLEEVLRHVNNRFEMEEAHGSFSISGGTLEVPDCLNGQYYWIEGSVMNDGLHLHPDTDMRDEEFSGKVTLLAIPRGLVDLSDEIAAWNEEHAAQIDGPYQSESFGGYSYSRAQGASSGGEAQMDGWRLHFAGRLRPYRKLSRDWA